MKCNVTDEVISKGVNDIRKTSDLITEEYRNSSIGNITRPLSGKYYNIRRGSRFIFSSRTHSPVVNICSKRNSRAT